ncbi:MAG: type II secretion system F family protein, partial [Thaumarchaeota archaeon]|nr:type II secretion system F family protein [Nitrososphaerota archaeon]
MPLEKRKTYSKSKSQEAARKINQELPYFIAIITLMASSGISPFVSLKKIVHLDLLPNMSREAKRMIKQIEILGMDPLMAMNRRASETLSNQYRDFLSGYVSTVQAGGSIVHFLKSKMDSIFDLQGAIAKELVTKLSALVDGYMIIQVVMLTMYIMFVVLSNTPSLAVSILPDPESTTNLFYIFLMMPPLLAGALMFIAHQMTTSTYMGTERILKKNLLLTLIVVPAVIIVSLVLPLQHIGLPYFLAVALLASSIISFSGYVKIEKMNSAAERVTPNILRNIAESRRTGLSPERCVV